MSPQPMIVLEIRAELRIDPDARLVEIVDSLDLTPGDRRPLEECPAAYVAAVRLVQAGCSLISLPPTLPAGLDAVTAAYLRLAATDRRLRRLTVVETAATIGITPRQLRHITEKLRKGSES